MRQNSEDNRTITARQIKAIHACRNALNMDDDTYRALVSRFSSGRATTSKAMTLQEATAMLQHLKHAGAPLPKRSKRTPAGPTGTNVTALATPLQRQFIDQMKARVHWREQDGYQRWLEASLHIKKLVTKTDASRVIEGLKGMIKHQETANQPEA